MFSLIYFHLTLPFISAGLGASRLSSVPFQMEPIDPQKIIASTTSTSILATSTTTTAINSNVSAGNDPRSPTETVMSAAISSMGTSREDEDSSNQNSSDCKSPGNRYVRSFALDYFQSHLSSLAMSTDELWIKEFSAITWHHLWILLFLFNE